MGILTGKVAIVTGASRSNGMGFAAAKAMAAKGADVVVTDLTRKRHDLDFGDVYSAGDDQDAIQNRARDLEAFGVRSLAIGVDVTDPAQIQSCISQTVEELGGVDILFNNAGTAVGIGPFLELTDRQWDLSYEVHVKGAARFCKAVIPAMIDRGGGSIINNVSVWALKVGAGAASYVSTKAALAAMTKAIAVEFAASGVRCNGVCPGTIETEMNKVDMSIAMEGGIDAATARAQFEADCAMKRLGQASEVGDVVAFLASDQASYVTGALIPVDGAVVTGL